MSPPSPTTKHQVSRTDRRQPSVLSGVGLMVTTTNANPHIRSQINSFWGNGNDGNGWNELGEALMQLRERLQARQRH
ncbi:hypothetical protein V8E53_015718 [Lactarius tabidus]